MCCVVAMLDVWCFIVCGFCWFSTWVVLLLLFSALLAIWSGFDCAFA